MRRGLREPGDDRAGVAVTWHGVLDRTMDHSKRVVLARVSHHFPVLKPWLCDE